MSSNNILLLEEQLLKRHLQSMKLQQELASAKKQNAIHYLQIFGIAAAIFIVFYFAFPHKEKTINKECTRCSVDHLYFPTLQVAGKIIFEEKVKKKKKEIEQILFKSPYKYSTYQQRIDAFLKLISWAEGAGYNTGFGHNHVSDLSKHPCRAWKKHGYTSSAFGAYQVLCSTWKMAVKNLKKQNVFIKDASPTSQDLVAIYLMQKRGVLTALKQDNITEAIHLSSWEWASLPCMRLEEGFQNKGLHRRRCQVVGKSRYQQPTRNFKLLISKYNSFLESDSSQLIAMAK